MKQNIIFLTSLLMGTSVQSAKTAEPFTFRSGKNTTASQIGFIFIQGGDVPTTEYVNLVKSIGAQYPGELFSIMPTFFLDHAFPFNFDLNPTIRILDDACRQLQQTMTSAGIASPKIFIGGHSLGGIATQMFSQQAKRRANCPIAGTMVLGSTRQRQYDQEPLSFPVMTLTGFYDAQVKPMRSAETYLKWVDGKDEKQVLRSPVITLEDITHMGFASYNKPPKRVLETDMWPVVKIDEANQRIASVISDFLTIHSVSDPRVSAPANQRLLHSVVQSGELLKPYMDAMKLERSDHLQSPCSSPSSSEWCRSPLVEQAQNIVLQSAGITPPSSLIFQDNHVKWDVKRAPNQPQVQGQGCPSPSCKVTVTTSSKLAFSFRDKAFDTGSGYISADEIQMRLASPNAIAKALGVSTSTKSLSDNICKTINEQMYKVGRAMVPEKYVTRHEKFGQKLLFSNDKIIQGPFSDTQWTNEKLDFRVTGDKKSVEVVSPAHVSEDGISCKVLSPARVVEWIYLDGIRPNLGLDADFMRRLPASEKINLPWNL